jgi:hypothetical protein
MQRQYRYPQLGPEASQIRRSLCPNDAKTLQPYAAPKELANFKLRRGGSGFSNFDCPTHSHPKTLYGPFRSQVFWRYLVHTTVDVDPQCYSFKMSSSVSSRCIIQL